MKEILLNNGVEKLTCEVEGLTLKVRFDDEKHYFQYTLRDEGSYERFSDFIRDIYNEVDPDEAFAVINDVLQTDEIDEFVTEERYLYSDPRTDDEINAYEKEAFDKVWLMRSCNIADREPIHEVGRSAMLRIFATYEDIPEDGYTTWECGYWNGILAALRWVQGEERDFLDT